MHSGVVLADTIGAVLTSLLFVTGESLTPKDHELRLIQSKADIESPVTKGFVSVCTDVV